MSIAVIYRGGSFHPLEPVEIPEDTKLQIELVEEGGLRPATEPIEPDIQSRHRAVGCIKEMSDSFDDPIPEIDGPIGGMEKTIRERHGMGLIVWMSDDFDDPIPEFFDPIGGMEDAAK